MMGHLEALGSNQQDQGENNKQTNNRNRVPLYEFRGFGEFHDSSILTFSILLDFIIQFNYYSGELKNGSQEVFRGGAGFSGLKRIQPLHLKLCRPDSF